MHFLQISAHTRCTNEKYKETHWDGQQSNNFRLGTVRRVCLKLRCAGGREFDPRPGQYSRMSFSSEQVTGTVLPHLNMPFLPNSEFI